MTLINRVCSGFFLLFCYYTDGDLPCKIEDVLVFFSGSDQIPPLGFDEEPSVVFLHDQGSRFATASTCSLQLRLPTCHGDNYTKFKEDIILSVKGNDGFGGI